MLGGKKGRHAFNTLDNTFECYPFLGLDLEELDGSICGRGSPFVLLAECVVAMGTWTFWLIVCRLAVVLYSSYSLSPAGE